VRLDDKEDAFTGQLDLVKGGKSPIGVLFDPYKDKISSQKAIEEAVNVNTLKIPTDDDDTAFQTSIT